MSKAIVLLSGGLDSTTTLAIAKSQSFDCYALSFDYGQKQYSELVSAKFIANDVVEWAGKEVPSITSENNVICG